MMTGFRWGILGTGEVSRKFAAGLCTVPGAELSWIASRERARAEALASSLGTGRGIGGYSSALNAGADAVYVATPAALHAEHAVACLEAGLPVLIEKPFAADAAGAARIVDAARAMGLFCMEAMWTRFHPAVAAARAALAAGEIGAPRHLRAEFCIASRPGGSLYDPAAGGGALLQRGVYPLSLAVHLLGWPEIATAMCHRGPTGVDEEVVVTLRHPGDVLSQLRASLRASGDNGLEVLGENGALGFDGPVFRPWGIRLRKFSPRAPLGAGRLAALRERPVAQRLQQWLAPLRAPRWSHHRVPYAGNGYGHQAVEVMGRIHAGETESPLMPLDESAALVGLMERLLTEGVA